MELASTILPFPSGGLFASKCGPRAAVVEESKVCTARYTMHKTKLGYYEVLRFIISELLN